jgi:hypothetical protein
MNSRTEVESRLGPVARAVATGTAVAKPQQTAGPREILQGIPTPSGGRREDRLSVDPLRETDRYRLVQTMPLPQ